MVGVAEADSVGEVGVAVFEEPRLEVVGFGPGGWPVALGPDATAVAGAHRGALGRSEETLLAADVEGLAGVGEEDSDVAGVAELPFDGGERDRGGTALDGPVPGREDHGRPRPVRLAGLAGWPGLAGLAGLSGGNGWVRSDRR